MSQFFKFYSSFATEPNLTPAQMVLLTYIFNRMASSQQRKAFYDDEQQDYFVIFTNDELADLMHISPSSVKRLIDKSVKNGFITTKVMHNRNRLIFMTAKSKHMAGMDTTPQPVQIEPVPAQIDPLIRINKHNNTDITLVTKKSAQPQIKISDSVITNNLINTLRQNVNLSDTTIQILMKHFANSAQLYMVVGLLFKAKANASKQLNHKLRFEDADVNDLIERNLYTILLNAKRTKKIKNKNAYIYGALFKMFINAYTVDSENVKPAKAHNHALKRRYSGHKPRIEKRPDWMQPGYKAPELSAEEYAKYENKLNHLMHQLNIK